MQILLARHGNTFSPGDKVVWVGRKNDLPLVEKGLEQACHLAQYLKEQGLIPTVTYCSHLQRTQVFAERVLQALELSLTPLVDERLNEIDYGAWSGLSNQEIIERYGDKELIAWNEKSTWPVSAGWDKSAEAIQHEVKTFVTELTSKYKDNDVILLVSSNGVLRYFLSLIPGEFEQRVQAGTFKMKTGHVSLMQMLGDDLTIEYWDIKPQ